MRNPFTFAAFVVGSVSVLLPACGSSAPVTLSEAPDAAVGGPSPKPDAATTTPASDAGSTPVVPDAATTPGTDSGPDPTDGPPQRLACTGNFGSALSTYHGRLDGYLVAIVQPHSSQTCNSDSHVHLQVSMGGATYDVATNLQTLYLAQDLPLPDGAWSEGWHSNDALDYPSLGIHSPAFTQPASDAALAAIVTADLASANHISIFATGYGPGGIHDIHRKGTGHDGAIIINPLSATAHGLFFRFTTDSF